MANPVVVLDACVLIPASLCDTLLRAASAGFLQIQWSQEILQEVAANLVENRLTTTEQAQRRIAAMESSFPDAAVKGYQDLVDNLEVDPQDRHVLAADIVAGARTIVTFNLRHVPVKTLDSFQVRAIAPDDFFLQLIDDHSSPMAALIQQQADDLTRSPMTVGELTEVLSRRAPRFAATPRELLSDP